MQPIDEFHRLIRVDIRPAEDKDSAALLAWRNDPLTRAMSKCGWIVDQATHDAWFAKNKSSILIAVVDGIAVGTFRVNDGYISYTVDPNNRRRGLGTEMLALAFARFGILKAEIFRRNIASIKAAQRAGFIITILEDTVDVVDDIQRVRTDNNKLWMDILRLALKSAPDEAKTILAKINANDKQVSALVEKLAES